MKYMAICSQFLLAITLLFGCSKQSTDDLSAKEKQFVIRVSNTNMNIGLNIVVESKKQYFSSGSEIPLLIVNKSSQFIYFDMSTNLLLLAYIDDQWVEIQNVLTYSGDIPKLSPQGSFPSDQLRIFVKPVLEEVNLADRNAIVPLRIVVQGGIMTDDTPTGEIVGAYTDVSLKQSTANPTYVIIQSTAETITFDGGSIHGTITSADNLGKPLPDVIVQLETHPFFSESNRIQVIATTTTNAEGRYHFDKVEPGVYALETIMYDGMCGLTDWSKSIKIEIGSDVTANLSLTCPYQ